MKEKPVKISSKKTFPGSKFELQITGGKCRPDPEIPIFEIPMPIPVPDWDTILIACLVLGEMDMDPADMTLMQRTRRKMLRLHLAKLYWPRFNVGGIRFLDYIQRSKSHYADWTNTDHFNLMNMSHVPTFKNPGFAELGMRLNCPLEAIHECSTNYFVSFLNFFCKRPNKNFENFE